MEPIHSSGSPHSSLSFSFLHFMYFLKDNNVFSIAVAAVLSERISDLINACIDTLVMPVIDRDADNDGIKDIKKLEEKVIEIHGIKFTIGKLFTSIIKFILVTYIVFIVSRMVRKMAKNMNIRFDN